MNILIVYAHHEPSSLTATMKNLAIEEFSAQGHEVVVSDLYTQGFSAVAQKWDFVTTTGKHFNYMLEQKHAASLSMSFAPDIGGEIDKLLKADLVLFVAPIWWLSVPAIMKGWFDRVLAMGVAWDGGKVYENGLLRGKQAMMMVSAGGPEDWYREEGMHLATPLQILHPIHYGTLAYCGFDVHEPFIAMNVMGMDQKAREQTITELQYRLKNMIASPNWLIRL